MNVLIRADGSTSIGTGHLMRCLALTQAGLDSGLAVTLASAEIPDPVGERFREEGVSACAIEALRGSVEDARQTGALAQRFGAAWIVLDGYAFDLAYQRAVRSNGARVFVVDDLAQSSRYEADLLLNQNLGVEASRYPGLGDSHRLLLGPRYALLRREYARWRDWSRRDPPRRPRLLVTLGGSDARNVTGRVLEGIRGFADRLEAVTVIVGASNPNRAALEKTAGSLDAHVELRSDVRDMPEVLASADLAVSAGGTTCWELAFMGLPSVVIAIADNQREIAQALDREGLAVSVGWHAACDDRTIGEAMQSLVEAPEVRARMSQRGRELVDGLGAGRVCAILASSG